MILKKLNDNQIQCILTTDELKAEHVSFADLVQGSPAARVMIDKVLRWALLKFDYSLEGMPFRIEAMPVHQGKVLVRISRVSMDDLPEDADADDEGDTSSLPEKPAERPLSAPPPGMRPVGSIEELLDHLYSGSDDPSQDVYFSDPSTGELCRIRPFKQKPLLWNFPTMARLLDAIRVLDPLPDLTSVLLRDERLGGYLLIIWDFPDCDHLREDIANRFFEVMEEYAFEYELIPGLAERTAEHYTPVLESHAIRTLVDAVRSPEFTSP